MPYRPSDRSMVIQGLILRFTYWLLLINYKCLDFLFGMRFKSILNQNPTLRLHFCQAQTPRIFELWNFKLSQIFVMLKKGSKINNLFESIFCVLTMNTIKLKLTSLWSEEHKANLAFNKYNIVFIFRNKTYVVFYLLLLNLFKCPSKCRISLQNFFKNIQFFWKHFHPLKTYFKEVIWKALIILKKDNYHFVYQILRITGRRL